MTRDQRRIERIAKLLAPFVDTGGRVEVDDPDVRKHLDDAMAALDRAFSAAKAHDKRVTCPACLTRMRKGNDETLRTLYNIGNPAKPEMGHHMRFMKFGRTGLCAADPRTA